MSPKYAVSFQHAHIIDEYVLNVDIKRSSGYENPVIDHHIIRVNHPLARLSPSSQNSCHRRLGGEANLPTPYGDRDP
jgi:hypothetical protein